MYPSTTGIGLSITRIDEGLGGGVLNISVVVYCNRLDAITGSVVSPAPLNTAISTHPKKPLYNETVKLNPKSCLHWPIVAPSCSSKTAHERIGRKRRTQEREYIYPPATGA